jgi:hypothetical protein
LEQPWQRSVSAFLDSELLELYEQRKIDKTLQAHEKIEKVIAIIKESEQNFNKAIAMLTSLDRLKAQRQELMKSIRSKAAEYFIVPFLPIDYTAKLDEVYTRIQEYIENRNELRVLEIYENTKEKLQSITQEFDVNDTLYSKKIAKNVGKKLLELIEQDFSHNPAVQPADIIIEARNNKKYPLHLYGQVINLGFVVRNKGQGYSYKTKLTLLSDELKISEEEEIQVGRLAPNSFVEISVGVMCGEKINSAELLIEIDWRNFDDTQHEIMDTIAVYAQRSDINWENLGQSDPYSLEPVTTEHDLIGRKDLLNGLLATLKASSIGSAIIRGQKRVGKTSLARTIQSHLEKEGYLVIYIEAGDYVEASPTATVSRLGNRICKEMIEREPKMKHIKAQKFEDALSPLAEFLEDFIKIAPERRAIFILDEFDELPLELYARGALGDSFFLTLRSVSSRQNVGFVLVGSEKVTHVMDCQGDKLNKWKVVPVDYFSRQSDWSDYKELIQRPVVDSLEYTDDALFTLHEFTSGNPYFTKLICHRVFRMAVSKRDCHITKTEIDQAIEIVIRETERNTFQHFWEDGIYERGNKSTDKSIRRRRILIAISDILKTKTSAPKKEIIEHPLLRDMAAVEADLKEFVARIILTFSQQDDSYCIKVLLFSKWLRERGVEDIIATFADLDAALREKQQEEEIKVSYSEIQSIIKKWNGSYKGIPITAEQVKTWLTQFSQIREQRAMFTMLNGLRFYSNLCIRNKMKEIHDIVKRGTTHKIDQNKKKRSDILVSYLDNPAKSGADIARLYVDEVGIYQNNVIEKSKLADKLKETKDIQALLFLDDFVGTGKSAVGYLQEIDSLIFDIVNDRKIRVVFAAVVAYIDGWAAVEKISDNLNMSISIHACDILNETAKCFSEKSSIFPSIDERENAKEITLKYGKLLEKNCPLGYGNLEMAVVFERGCPNNSLPVLWSESTSLKWIPLFKRL